MAATLVAQTAYDLYMDPDLVDGGLGGVPRRRLTCPPARPGRRRPPPASDRGRFPLDCRGAFATMRPAPRWTVDSEPAASLVRDVRSAGRLRERLRRNRVSERPHDPAPATGFAAQHGWDREFEVFSDFDLPTYVGPSTFSNLPWITDPAELRARKRRRGHRRRARSTTWSPTVPVRDSARGRSARRSTAAAP